MTLQKWFPRYFRYLLLCLLILQFPYQKTEAKAFRNSYVSFELPPQWQCYMENMVWLCRHAVSKKCLEKSNDKACKTQKKKKKEAIIVFTAKERGPKDSFPLYLSHLKTPRPHVTSTGKHYKSKIIHAKNVKIQKHRWVDGMHLGGEIPHYYTRYLATIKGNIAILVTFSAHKLFYTKYSSQFFNAIKSLRVIASKSSMVSRKELRSKNVGTFGVNIGAHLDTAIDEAGLEEEGAGGFFGFFKDPLSGGLIIGAIVLLLLGIFLWIRGKK